MVRRAEIAQTGMRLALRCALTPPPSAAICRSLARPRSAPPDLRRSSPAASGGASSSSSFLTTDKRRFPRAQRLEAADLAALAHHSPGALRLAKAGEWLRPKILQIEQPTDLPACRFANDQRVRRGQGLQPGGEVRRLADDAALLRRAAPIRSPTTASPVAMPSRTRKSSRAGNLPTASITASPARTAPGRRRPHGPAGNRRSAPRRPCIWRQAARSGRPSRRRRGGSRRSARANPPGHAGSRARSSQITEHHRQLAAFGIGLYWR